MNRICKRAVLCVHEPQTTADLTQAYSACGTHVPDDCNETHSVIVVGAGLAGLYAAKLLHKRYPDVIVLEATEQPGGRVRQAG